MTSSVSTGVRLLRLIAGLVDRALGDHGPARAASETEAQERLTRSLRHSRRELQSILDHGPSVIFVKSVEGRYLLINREYERLFALSPDEVIGRTDREIFGAAVPDEVIARDRAVIASGEAVTEEEVIPIGGRLRTYMSTKFALRDAEGRVYALCGMATDVSERKRTEDELRVSEQRLAEAQHVARLGSFSLTPALGRLETSAELRALHGVSEADVEDLTQWTDPVHPTDMAALNEDVKRALAGGGGYQRDYRATIDGRERIFEARGRLVRGEDGDRIAGTAQDVTEQRRVEQALRRSEQRARAILESAQEAFVSIGEHGRITEWNPAAEATFGWTRHEALGREVVELIVPRRLRASYAEGQRRMLDGGPASGAGRRFELSALHREGHELPIEMTTSATCTDEGLAVHAFIRDVTERKRAEQALAHQALHDPLTALPNRTLLLDRLTRALGRARRDGSRCAVLLVDVDNFKTVNDSLGHDLGDELLVELARRLNDVVRVVDTVARFGGDEFVLVADSIRDERRALELAQRVLDVFAQPFSVGGHELVVSGSLGVALADGACVRAEDVVRDADAAMHRAKDRGRGTFEVFDEQLREDVVRRLRVEHDLRRALGAGELRNVYQPIVDLQTGRAVAVEALVRWQHPEHGLVSPADFVPVAEESGLIGRLGEEVLRRACRDVAAWGQIDVSLNVSAHQLADPSLAATVAEALADAGLPASRLVLELTETALMTDDAAVAQTLVDLQALGVRLSLDDFGTGYSSLSYLHELPATTLKLDRSFIARIADDERSHALVSAVVQLADGLGLKVVAEGVETPEQACLLARLGTAYAQGYLFCRPVAAEVLDAQLATTGEWHAPAWSAAG